MFLQSCDSSSSFEKAPKTLTVKVDGSQKVCGRNMWAMNSGYAVHTCDHMLHLSIADDFSPPALAPGCLYSQAKPLVVDVKEWHGTQLHLDTIGVRLGVKY